jgi:hypothetical protein
LLSALALAQENYAILENLSESRDRPDSDPKFEALEEQYLMFPMIKKDYAQWKTVGTSIFLENKAVIVPEVK